METRRLKLFVVAYLRGILKPDYGHGIRSKIREEFILTALNDELDAESLSESINLDLAFSTAAPPENRTGLYDKVYDKILDIRSLREFSGKYKDDVYYEQEAVINTATKKAQKRHVQDSDQLVELYKYLEDSGLLKQLSKVI